MMMGIKWLLLIALKDNIVIFCILICQWYSFF